MELSGAAALGGSGPLELEASIYRVPENEIEAIIGHSSIRERSWKFSNEDSSRLTCYAEAVSSVLGWATACRCASPAQPGVWIGVIVGVKKEAFKGVYAS